MSSRSVASRVAPGPHSLGAVAARIAFRLAQAAPPVRPSTPTTDAPEMDPEQWAATVQHLLIPED